MFIIGEGNTHIKISITINFLFGNWIFMCISIGINDSKLFTEYSVIVNEAYYKTFAILYVKKLRKFTKIQLSQITIFTKKVSLKIILLPQFSIFSSVILVKKAISLLSYCKI